MFSADFKGQTDWNEGYVFGPGIDGEWYKVTAVEYDHITDHTHIEYEEATRDA